MQHVDALSKAPVEMPSDTEGMLMDGRLEVLTTMTEEDYVITMQRTDTRLRVKIKILNREELGRSKHDSQAVVGYILDKGILYREVKFGEAVRKL